MIRTLAPLALCALLADCGGSAPASSAAQPPSATAMPSSASSPQPSSMPASCAAASPAPTPTPGGPAPSAASGLSVPTGFTIAVIGHVPGARELAFAPNGDLFVGTSGASVYLIADAETQANYPHVFAKLADAPAAGVAFSIQACSLFIGTQFGVYRVAYTSGDQTARSTPVKIASVRTGGGGDHSTTSVATIGRTLYASVGSSCNACTETDPTRATVQQMQLDGTGMTAKAVHVRNAIALAVNPATNTLWIGGAGQDSLPVGHPYEYFDPLTLHTGIADYGWPECEENHIAYAHGANCAAQVVPAVEFPAYQTIIGAAFYPASTAAPFAFPAQYRGGAFVAMHGSWHANAEGIPVAPPRVAFVSLTGDVPRAAVNWSNPTVQWSDFVFGFQRSNGTRIGRPTGIAVGPQGDLFIADDQTGNIYRVRP